MGPILIQMEKMQVAKKCCQSLKQSRAGLSRLVSALKQIQAVLKQLASGSEANQRCNERASVSLYSILVLDVLDKQLPGSRGNFLSR